MDSSESVISRGRQMDAWLSLLVFAVLLALYSSTLLSFYNVYTDEGAGQSHAPLLLAVSLYLLYRAWSHGGRQLSLRFNYLAILSLAGLSLLWMVLGLVFVEAGQQAIFLLIIAAAIVALLGFRGGARYLIPVLLLLTVVPVWSPLIPYLQTLAAQSSALVLDLGGMTLTREGYLLIIPNGTFEVADSCSGLKFQIVGITLALIHTQLIRVPLRVMLVYVVLASMLAFVSNVLRIAVVVLIGYQFGMTHDYVQDHNFIGWIIFSLFFFLFLFVGERKLRQHEIGNRSSAAGASLADSGSQQRWGIAMVLLAIAIGPVLYGYFANREPAISGNQVSQVQQIPGWQVEARQLTDWEPRWTEGDHTFEGTLSNGRERLDLYVTQFNRQRQGNEAVNVSHRVYDVEKWSRISRSAKVIETPDAGRIVVEETLLKSPDRRKRLVWQWYWVDNRIVASSARAKMNNLIGVMTGDPAISAFVVSKMVVRSEAHAASVLETFLQAYLAQAFAHSEA